MTVHYFDHASSVPPYGEALECFNQTAALYYGNPSAAHSIGADAYKFMHELKKQFLKLCGCRGARLIMTSGGTEANNLVIKGVMKLLPRGRLLLAADAHASSWFADDLFKGRVDVVPLDSDGGLSLPALQRLLKKNTTMLSVVHACGETGTIHDISAYAEFCRQNKLFFHCDGVQALGHVALQLHRMHNYFYTFSAHKFGGTRGFGGVVGQTAELAPQMSGGVQEHGVRAGTENIAGLAAASKALELSCKELPDESRRLYALSRTFVQLLGNKIDDLLLNSNDDGLPGLISITFPGTVATNVVAEMSVRGFALTTGAACHSDQIAPSRIIMAHGRTSAEALATVRISMGRDTTFDSVKNLAATLADVVNKQKTLG